MNCKNCGSVIKDGSKFCAGCGQTVHEAAVPVSNYSQPVYGGYAQAQQPGFGAYPGAQQPGYNVRPQLDYGYYGVQQKMAGQQKNSGIQLFFVLFMVFSLLMTSVGVMRFPLTASSEMDAIGEYTNMSTLSMLWNANDGKIGDIIEDTVNGMDEEPLFVIGFLISVTAFLAAVIMGVIALICGLAGSHSIAASMTGVGLLILVLGYLGSTLEAIDFLSDLSGNVKMRIGVMPPVMIAVCVMMSIFAFISAGKIKKID